jgi:hypothetical protein
MAANRHLLTFRVSAILAGGFSGDGEELAPCRPPFSLFPRTQTGGAGVSHPKQKPGQRLRWPDLSLSS